MSKLFSLVQMLMAVLALVPFTATTAGEIKVTNIRPARDGQLNKILIDFEGKLSGVPELSVNKQVIQVAIPESKIYPKIEKKIQSEEAGEATLMGYQYEKGLARVRLVLTDMLGLSSDNADLTIKENEKGGTIELNVRLPKGKNKVTRAEVTERKIENEVVKEKYDEKYLDELLKDKKENIEAKKEEIKNDKNADPFFAGQNRNEGKKDLVKDSVGTKLSSVNSTNREAKDSQINVTNYVGKFVAFLGLVLLLFYGIVYLFKKGVITRGKLGLLNNGQLISVISSTYLGPKRSLVVVKAHKQVFLIGNSESGLSMLSELSDVADLLKESEVKITGTNFDKTLEKLERESKEMDEEGNDDLTQFIGRTETVEVKKVKKNNQESAVSTYTRGIASYQDSASLRGIQRSADDKTQVELDERRDTVKFSDQVKKKIKGLRPMQ